MSDQIPPGAGQEGDQMKSAAGQAGSAEGEGTSRPATPDEAAKAMGYKSWDDLARSHKEGHATITRLSQAKKELESKVADYDQLALAATQAPPAQDELGSVVETAIVKRELTRKLGALPPDQQLRMRQLMAMELAANPMIERHPDAVNILFNKAIDRAKGEREKFVKELFGEDATLERVKELVSGKKQNGDNLEPSDRLSATFTPDAGGGGGKSGSSKTSEERMAERQRKALESGDAEEVAHWTFRDTKKIIKPPSHARGK